MSHANLMTIGWITLTIGALMDPVGTALGIKPRTATAETVFLDTFDDGDYADGSPVTWTLPAHEDGVLDTTSGDFILSPVETSGEWVTADALDQHLDDVSIRTQGRVSENGGMLIVTVRTQAVAESEHYFAAVGYFETLGGTQFFVGRGDAGENMKYFEPSSPDIQLPFDVRSEDVVIQLDVIGEEVSAWAWRAGEEMPSEPQYIAPDSTYSEGYIRIILGNTYEGLGNSTATFRYVHVADEPIHLMVPEIDWLSQRIREGRNDDSPVWWPADVAFDLNGDGKVMLDDHAFWVKEIKNTWHGDANLDGLYQSDDLVTVLAAGQYEDDVVGNSTWGTGDWNGDGEFDSSDLILAFSDGGYEQGPPVGIAPVPEPCALQLLAVGGMWLAMSLARRRV